MTESEIVLEQDRGVYTDEVATRHLLIELKEDTEREAVEKLVLAHLEHVGELHGCSGGFLESELDSGDLGLDLDRVLRETTEGGNNGTGLVATVLKHEPSRRLGEEVDGSNQDQGKDDGDGNRRAPCHSSGLEFVEAQVDPRLQDISDTDEQASQDNLATTVDRVGRLGQPDGDNGTQLTNTGAENDATDDELSETKGGCFEDGTDQGKDTTLNSH